MSSTLLNALRVQRRVIGALILRDLRTRFGRTIFGALIIVGWPLSHLVALTIIYTLIRKVIPVGTDTTVFVATGIIPYILCLYPSRMILQSIASNKQLLSFPVIKSLDLIVARSIVEVIAAFWVVSLFLAGMLALDLPIWPERPEDAIAAILATIYLGFAFGMVGALMFAITKAWIAVHVLIMIGMYLSSGLFFIPSSLPQNVQNIIWFNPLMHSVEWLRSAYYAGYGYGLLDRSYLLGISTVLLFIGLIMERALRGRYLQT